MDSPYFFEGTTYWSEGDEKSHFAWLGQIKCVRSVRGHGRRLLLEIDEANMSFEGLRELEAIYRRYDGDLEQLDGLKAIDA